jgi:hypothetical protein
MRCASGFLSSYRPLNQLRPGSSFSGVPPPQSSFAQTSRLHLSMQAHLPRVSSLIAASPERVHLHEGSHAFALFRPQVFSTSRRFPPPSGFAGLFHPASHVQGCRRSGASLPAQPCSLIESRFLLAVVVQSPHRLLLDGSLSRPACRRMPRSERPDFEAFLRARQRCVRIGVQPTAARSPPRFSISSRS